MIKMWIIVLLVEGVEHFNTSYFIAAPKPRDKIHKVWSGPPRLILVYFVQNNNLSIQKSITPTAVRFDAI